MQTEPEEIVVKGNHISHIILRSGRMTPCLEIHLFDGTIFYMENNEAKDIIKCKDYIARLKRSRRWLKVKGD